MNIKKIESKHFCKHGKVIWGDEGLIRDGDRGMREMKGEGWLIKIKDTSNKNIWNHILQVN